MPPTQDEFTRGYLTGQVAVLNVLIEGEEELIEKLQALRRSDKSGNKITREFRESMIEVRVRAARSFIEVWTKVLARQQNQLKEITKE